MTLTVAPKGKALQVRKVTGKDETRAFLGNLGFTEGADVCIVSQLDGNMIVNVKETRIALDKTLSNRIFVMEG